MKRAYIAGKVTGLDPKEVEAKFAAKEAELRADGWRVFNPISYILELKNIIGKMSEKSIMKVLIGALANDSLGYEFTHLILLPDWDDSPNTLVEIQVAKACGIEVVYPNDNVATVTICADGARPMLNSNPPKHLTRIPFTIEAYNSGKYNVVTRDGQSVHITLIEDLDILEPIEGIIKGDMDATYWFADGKLERNKETVFDLFLTPKKA